MPEVQDTGTQPLSHGLDLIFADRALQKRRNRRAVRGALRDSGNERERWTLDCELR